MEGHRNIETTMVGDNSKKSFSDHKLLPHLVWAGWCEIKLKGNSICLLFHHDGIIERLSQNHHQATLTTSLEKTNAETGVMFVNVPLTIHCFFDEANVLPLTFFFFFYNIEDV